MVTIHEIAPEVFRLCVPEPQYNMQFNHFLVRDDEPLLFHAGYNRMFSELREAMRKLIAPEKLRWVGFSHFEGDECGALNQWLDLAPQARPVCTALAAAINVNDHARREARVVADEETFTTGKYRFRFCSTAHVPHGWDAAVLFEETQRTLFCSDLLFHLGDPEPLTRGDIVGPARDALRSFQNTPFGYSVPYTPQTDRIIEKLAALQPATLATMHGSSFNGDCAAALRGYGGVIKEFFGH
jgi:flavorubredoxin